MKHSSLKLKHVAGLVSLVAISTIPYVAESAPRNVVSIKPEDRVFMVSFVNKITVVVKEAEKLMSEFMSKENRDPYITHITRFEKLLTELQRDLIDPLNSRKQVHESFRLSHEILVELHAMLSRIHTTLKQHVGSTNYIALGMALKVINDDVEKQQIQQKISDKLKVLADLIERDATQEALLLREMLKCLEKNKSQKSPDNTGTILECLRNRLSRP